MNFHILTLFPDMVENGLKTSITGRAIESGAISVEAVDIRDYTTDKHRHVDDAPYGGGAPKGEAFWGSGGGNACGGREGYRGGRPCRS